MREGQTIKLVEEHTAHGIKEQLTTAIELINKQKEVVFIGEFEGSLLSSDFRQLEAIGRGAKDRQSAPARVRKISQDKTRNLLSNRDLARAIHFYILKDLSNDKLSVINSAEKRHYEIGDVLQIRINENIARWEKIYNKKARETERSRYKLQDKTEEYKKKREAYLKDISVESCKIFKNEAGQTVIDDAELITREAKERREKQLKATEKTRAMFEVLSYKNPIYTTLIEEANANVYYSNKSSINDRLTCFIDELNKLFNFSSYNENIVREGLIQWLGFKDITDDLYKDMTDEEIEEYNRSIEDLICLG